MLIIVKFYGKKLADRNYFTNFANLKKKLFKKL